MSGFFNAVLGGKGFTPLSVIASNVSRARDGAAATGSVTSVALPNTTITGGVGPYTQEWTNVGGDTPVISSSTALNPTWTATVADGTPNVSSWRVTVTDAVSATATYDIEVTLTWTQT